MKQVWQSVAWAILAFAPVVAAQECLGGKAVAEGVAKEVGAEGFKLVWADEFDQDGAPDPENWTYERGFVRNEEAQWYQPDNARCDKGMLIIEARQQRMKNPNYDATSP